MSESERIKWGKKGSCLGMFAIGLILFVCLLIFVYNHGHNQIG